MKKRNEASYMKCSEGTFTLLGQDIGSRIEVQILNIEYWLLKWVDGVVVKRRRYKENGRWPFGYEISAEIIMSYDERFVYLTVYGAGVGHALNPYLNSVAVTGLNIQDVLTRIECERAPWGNFLKFSVGASLN